MFLGTSVCIVCPIRLIRIWKIKICFIGHLTPVVRYSSTSVSHLDVLGLYVLGHCFVMCVQSPEVQIGYDLLVILHGVGSPHIE